MNHHDKGSIHIKNNNALIMVAQAAGPNFSGVLRHAIIYDPGDLMLRVQRTWAGIVGCDVRIAVVGLGARAAQAGS
jgi:hypothetical protein